MLILEGHDTLWEKGRKVGTLTLQEGERSERFVIVEQSSGPLREGQLTEAEEKLVSTLTEGKKDRKVLLTMEGVFQRADTKNANNRMYPDAIWKKVLASGSEQLEAIKNGDMLGESDHPKDGDTLLRRVACMVTDLRRCTEDTKCIKGRIVVFDNAAGRDLKAIHEGGGRLGVSSRGQGSVVRMDGVDVVQDDFQAQTWDVVYNPSTPGAYPSEMTEDGSDPTESTLNEGKNLGLWKANKRTGYWEHQREVTPETKDQWLAVWKKAEPDETFKISKNKPTDHIGHKLAGVTRRESRSGDWDEIVMAMAETPLDASAPLHEAMQKVRGNYRAKTGATGPLTEQERAALTFYVETASQGSATAGTGNHTARITFGGGLTESLGALVLRAKTSDELRQMVETRLSEAPSFITVEYDRAEAIYEECAARFNDLLEVQVEKAGREGADAAESDLSARLSAAKQLLQQSGMRIAETEASLEERESEVQVAEQLIEGIAAEFFAEGLKSAVAAIAATHTTLEDLPLALSQVDSLAEAVSVTKKMKADTRVFLEREPLPIRNRRIDEALKLTKKALLESSKPVEKREAPELATTNAVISAMNERGIGK